MNTLDKARQGKSAARQIRVLMNSGSLIQADLDRLLKKVEEGYEELLPAPLPRLEIEALERRSAFHVVRS